MSEPEHEFDLDVSSATDLGHQDLNEDQFLVAEDLGVFAVADGVGRGSLGVAAARLALETLQHELQARERDSGATNPDPDTVEQALRHAMQRACERVFEESSATAAHAGMATTLTAMRVVGTQAVLAHVGDTRLYLLRGGGLSQLTRDHTVAADMLRRGEITPEQAAQHRLRRALTRSLGRSRGVVIDVLRVGLADGDIVALTTDGVHDRLDDTALAAAMSRGASSLVEAVVRGAGDNATAIVLKVGHSSARADQRTAELDALTDQVFGDLSVRHQIALWQTCSHQMWIKHDTVLTGGSAGQHAVFVVEGTAIDDDGVSFAAGDVIEESQLIAGGPVAHTVKATSALRTLALKRADFAALCQRRPELGTVLWRRLAERQAANRQRRAGPDGP